MADILRNGGILVKCGGFATQLETHVREKIDGDPLWASRYDATDPAAVIQTHLDFLENGAQIILSNTYQSSVEGFSSHLLFSKQEGVQLMRHSVRLAKEAREKYLSALATAIEPGLPLVMASIGPYGAHLHDCSEYNGSYSPRITKSQIQEWHRTRIEACLAEGVDGLAIETIPCQMEGEALAELVLTDYPGVKFWISFQCKDEHSLAHGQNFAEAVHTIWRKVQDEKAEDRLLAIGVNCVNPKFVTPLFQSLRASPYDAVPQPPLIVYSNRGETYDTEAGEWTGQEQCVPLESYVPQWIELGAKIIGGCCRVYPSDILGIHRCIADLSHRN